MGLFDWWGFNGTYGTNWLYRAFEKYAVHFKKLKLVRKLKILRTRNTQTITVNNSGLCSLVVETLRH